jgi:hypothetical protein
MRRAISDLRISDFRLSGKSAHASSSAVRNKVRVSGSNPAIAATGSD